MHKVGLQMKYGVCTSKTEAKWGGLSYGTIPVNSTIRTRHKGGKKRLQHLFHTLRYQVVFGRLAHLTISRLSISWCSHQQQKLLLQNKKYLTINSLIYIFHNFSCTPVFKEKKIEKTSTDWRWQPQKRLHMQESHQHD